MSDDVLITRAGAIVTLTFNRPEARNAMTFEMYERLHDLCEGFDRDPGVRVVVLTGAGDKAFVSGTDIRQFAEFKTREDAVGYEARIDRILRRLHTMTKPTIAMIQGDAVGGGMGMALACDLRVAAEHARLGGPVARTLGNSPAPFGMSLLAATVGAVRAREILLTARLVDAAEAKAIGLVDRVCPAAELGAQVSELATQLADLAPLTLAAVKEATRRMLAPVALKDAEDIVLSCYLSETSGKACVRFSRSASRAGPGGDLEVATARRGQRPFAGPVVVGSRPLRTPPRSLHRPAPASANALYVAWPPPPLGRRVRRYRAMLDRI